MSLQTPTRKVEWTSDWSTWNDVSNDTIDFDVTVEDLALGPWSFMLTLNNVQGQYNTVFPSVGTEKGLGLGFRFTINGKLLGIFRVSDMAPWFDPKNGDIFKVTGLGLGHEAFRKFCVYPNMYPRYMADEIIYDQFTQIGLSDLSVSGPPFSAPRWTIVIPHTGKPYFSEMITELETNLSYAAFFDSTQKPAPLNFFSKTDSTKQLNVTIQSILNDQGNNILWGKEHRTTKTIKNHLFFHAYHKETIYFSTFIPNDQDAWTEDINNDFGQHWGVTVGVLQTDTTTVYYGTASICCTSGGGSGPDFWMIPANSMYGTSFNADNEGVTQLYFALRTNTTTILPRIILWDDAPTPHGIYIDLTLNVANTWMQFGVPVGSGGWASWQGVNSPSDVTNFNGNIWEIEFKDKYTGHTSINNSMWVDNLYFVNPDGYNNTYLEDSASVAKFGRWEDEVQLPYCYPFFNSWLWGTNLLAKLSSPNRVLQFHTLLDPALVMKSDGVTAASLLPGWQLQVNIPRYGILPVASGGVWWRILQTVYHWSELAFTVEFQLQSTAAESPDDYSFLDVARFAGITDTVRYRLVRSNEDLKRKSRQLAALEW